jgi:hypothetical protein
MIKSKLKKQLRLLDTDISKWFFEMVSVSNVIIEKHIIDKRDYTYQHTKTNELKIISENISKKQLLLDSLQYQKDIFAHKAFVYKLSGANFKISKGGFVIFNNSKILLESCNHEEIYFSRFFSKVALRIGLFSTSRVNVNHIYALEHKLDFNYWHLHAELIPQIAVILKTFFTKTGEKLSVLIRKDFPTAYREMLLKLFEDRISFIYNGYGFIKGNFIYVTGEMYSRQFQKGGNFIQSRNLAFWDAVNVFKPKKLKIPKVRTSFDVFMISRRKATSRRLLNEDDLGRALTSNGIAVNIVCLEDYSWIEQLSVLQAAKIVIAAHGAHSASLLYIKPVLYLEIVNFNRDRGLYPVTDVVNITQFQTVKTLLIDSGSAINQFEDYELSLNHQNEILKAIKDEISK